MKIASFDIGAKNFAFYVEEIGEINALECELKKITSKLRKKIKGKYQPEMETFIEKVCLCGKGSILEVIDIRSVKTKDFKLDIETRRNLFSLLEKYKTDWIGCDTILIEEQYSSWNRKLGAQANIKAIKIAEATLCWFMLNLPDKEVINFRSSFKTNTLGAPKLTKPQRKVWAKNKTKNLLEKSGNIELLNKFNSCKNTKEGLKQDDISDAFLQCQAYKLKEIFNI